MLFSMGKGAASPLTMGGNSDHPQQKAWLPPRAAGVLSQPAPKVTSCPPRITRLGQAELCCDPTRRHCGEEPAALAGKRPHSHSAQVSAVEPLLRED